MDNVKLADIDALNRNRQPPQEGENLFTDLLWADPMAQKGRAPSPRGEGKTFGPDITDKFCQQNKITYILRAHQMCDKGFENNHTNKLFTVFSAPNYCDQMGNKGAICIVRRRSEDKEKEGGKAVDYLPEFIQYDASPHPKTQSMQYANPLLRFGM
ncbi:MAG: putative Serine/threonine-protein phosphatase 5, partial [Streblomastix strix]